MITPLRKHTFWQVLKKPKYTFCREFNSALNDIFAIPEFHAVHFLRPKNKTRLKIQIFSNVKTLKIPYDHLRLLGPVSNVIRSGDFSLVISGCLNTVDNWCFFGILTHFKIQKIDQKLRFLKV